MNSQNLVLMALILGATGFFCAVFALLNLRVFNKLRKTFFSGARALDLEEVIHALEKNIKDLKNEHQILEQAFSQLQNDFTYAVQKLGVVRFNTFQDQGGDFSFCVALLNGRNSGVVITSMHGREQNRTYTKKITDGKSESRLTEEEQQAIMMASVNNQ
jgi:hypothetical protein